MKVLMLVDDFWHPGEVIQRGLRSFVREGLELDYVSAPKDILTRKFVGRYDVLAVCRTDCVTPANQNPWFDSRVTEFGPEEFAEYVRAGGGLVAIHSGLTIGKEDRPVPAYTDMTGSYFVTHPPRELTRVHITRQCMITEGVKDFAVRDEHYQLKFTGEVEPFMETESEHGGRTVSGYTRPFGSGRVAALAPGHNLEVWEHPEFRKLFVGALRYACGHD